MENGPIRAEFWKAFILEKSEYPSPSRLREQFENTDFTDFCDCGCNSFGLKVREGSSPKPLLPPNLNEIPGGHWKIYEADFLLPDEKPLEIMICADRYGNLAYVEVDCCSNAYPVPTTIEVKGPPFHIDTAEGLYG